MEEGEIKYFNQFNFFWKIWNFRGLPLIQAGRSNLHIKSVSTSGLTLSLSDIQGIFIFKLTLCAN